MSHTNHTQYYELPQYVGSDIINPLVDTNGAYETIDTTMHSIAAEAGQGTSDIAALQSKVGDGVFDTTAQNATDAVNEVVAELNTAETGVKARLATAESDIDTLQSQMVTAQGNITDLQNNKADTSDVNDALALKANLTDVDAINTKIGSGEPTTTDKRIVGAINELNDDKLASSGIYALKGRATKTVTADGIKTYGALLRELAQATLSWMQTQNNKFLQTVGMYIPYIGFVNANDNNGFSATTPHFSQSGFQINNNDTKLIIRAVSMYDDSDPYNYIKVTEIDNTDGTITFTNLTNDVPASDTVISVILETYDRH